MRAKIQATTLPGNGKIIDKLNAASEDDLSHKVKKNTLR
jgi:hypothetical protein